MTRLPPRILGLLAFALLLPGCAGEGRSAARGTADIFLINADGSGLLNVTNDPSLDADPAWSPDGTRLAFGTSNGAFEGDIVVVNADGSGRTRLAATTNADSMPAWSPDGTKVAFANVDAAIYVVGADGTGLTKVADLSRASAVKLSQRPAWAVDGTRLLYTVGEEIWAVNPDGSGATRLTQAPGSASDLAMSPDGTRIAFAAGGPGPVVPEGGPPAAGGVGPPPNPGLPGQPGGGASTGGGLYVVNADGTGLSKLADGMPDLGRPPAWSPDGTKLLFVAAGPRLTTDVFVVNADGSGLTNLTNDESQAQDPAWSPDGARIAFAAYTPSGGYAIVVMNADGSGRVRLADTEGDDRQPAWSPVGARLAFSSTPIVPYTD